AHRESGTEGRQRAQQLGGGVTREEDRRQEGGEHGVEVEVVPLDDRADRGGADDERDSIGPRRVGRSVRSRHLQSSHAARRNVELGIDDLGAGCNYLKLLPSLSGSPGCAAWDARQPRWYLPKATRRHRPARWTGRRIRGIPSV